MKKLSKPYPYSLSVGGYEILYRCRKCGCRFPMRNDSYNYCHQCGVKLDWGVILEANEEWRSKFVSVARGRVGASGYLDHSERDKMLEELDRVNQAITDGVPCEMEMTEATRRANLKTNINYYLGQGWTKGELIK